MSHTFAQLFVHLTFATKDRAPRITHLDQLGNYLGAIAKTNKAELLASGGMPDHLHLLIHLPTSISLGELVSKLKANSSRWLSERTPGFRWQEGYGAFSVSASALDSVRRYIATQPEHHKRRNYDEELAALLRLYGYERPTDSSDPPSPKGGSR